MYYLLSNLLKKFPKKSHTHISKPMKFKIKLKQEFQASMKMDAILETYLSHSFLKAHSHISKAKSANVKLRQEFSMKIGTI